ncbi:MAG: ribonuclease D [Deltaproteobacteria bacterium]|nr:ribonuclease D [Deltaproteobacteria bacterium]MBW2383590.1 ribonuclease D [Deltaproteobacteria bacterium]
MADFDIITELSDLESLARDLLREDVVAVDTEADSFYHYFDKTCLVQIATRKHAWLIDPIALGGPAELAPLAPVFASPDVRLLLHAAEYDIFVLKRDCGFEFNNLFDTMVSAQLLGYPAIGLAALIEHHFGVRLPKDEQRSDWSRRPLSEKQLTYAASDVLYLVRLAAKIEKELRKKGRLEWAMADFEALTKRKWPDREFDRLGYLRIKGARALGSTELAVLRELFLMRDARAREVDRPPFKVLGNRALLELAHARPDSPEALARIKGVSDLIIRRMGKDIFKAIAKGCKKPHGPIPKLEGNGRRRMDRRTERRVARLKTWRTPRAKELEIDPGVLCPNAALEAIAFANPKSSAEMAEIGELKVWLSQSFGEEIVEVLADDQGAKDEKAAPRRKRR